MKCTLDAHSLVDEYVNFKSLVDFVEALRNDMRKPTFESVQEIMVLKAYASSRKILARLHICAVSPESSLLAHSKKGRT